MELEVLGIGNAFTTVHNNTSFLISQDLRFLIDGPQSLFKILRQRGLGPADIDGVIATHIHGDHVSGLETLLIWKRGVQGVRTPLYTSRRVYKELESRFFPSFAQAFSSDLMKIETRTFDSYVEFRELSETSETQLTSGLSAEIRHNWHPTPTLGIKLHTNSHSVGISGDTCYRPSLLAELRRKNLIDQVAYDQLAGDWLWSADVIYHEADKSTTGPHTSEYDLLQLPDHLQNKIRLVHVPDETTDWGLNLAREGERVVVDAGKLRIIQPEQL